MPKYVRTVSSCSVDKFKSHLDKHLRNIVDHPCLPAWIQQQSGCYIEDSEWDHIKNWNMDFLCKFL